MAVAGQFYFHFLVLSKCNLNPTEVFIKTDISIIFITTESSYNESLNMNSDTFIPRKDALRLAIIR
jgi:hypothetical protein